MNRRQRASRWFRRFDLEWELCTDPAEVEGWALLVWFMGREVMVWSRGWFPRVQFGKDPQAK